MRAVVEIKLILNSEAKVFVERWHYSKRIPTGKNICYGAFKKGELYAVIVYGIGVNPYQSKFLGVNNVLEIKRMCRVEPADTTMPMSKFISKTSRLVYREFPYDCLIAFADPAQGHEGGVYKASGFTMHGKTNAEWHLIDEAGVIRHRRYAYRYAKRNGISAQQSREQLGVKRIQTPPKFRWVRPRRKTKIKNEV